MRLLRALYEAQFWVFLDMESLEYTNPGIEGQIFSLKDDLFGGRYELRLPVSDPIWGIKKGLVSTLIKNTVLIGYFAKISLYIGILACVFSSVIFITVSATS